MRTLLSYCSNYLSVLRSSDTRTSFISPGNSLKVILTIAIVFGLAAAIPVRAADVIVASESNSTIFRINSSTGASTIITSGGNLSLPGNVVFGPGGDLYVSNFGGGRIVRIAKGTNAQTLVTSGGLLGCASSLTFGPDGNLYVSNECSNNIVRVNNPTTLSATQTLVTSGGSLSGTGGLAFGSDGNLYVANYSGLIVRINNPTTNSATQTVVSSGGSLAGCYRLTFGPDGNLYVSTQGNNIIVRVNNPLSNSATQTVVTSGGSLATGEGLAFGTDGILYVVNRGNTNIVRIINPTTNSATQSALATSAALSSALGIVWAENSIPSSAAASISGRITAADGAPLGGAVVSLSGAKTALAITDSLGNYRFSDLEANGFYTLTPSRANYSFAPTSRSFSLTAESADAPFSATADAVEMRNPLDTSEYFVRQQYLDFLGREPDAEGFGYWSGQLGACGADAACLSQARIGVSAAFFIEAEFQQTGSFVYRLYRAAYGARPSYAQFTGDRVRVLGGSNLEASKAALADEFVTRAEFKAAYPQSLSNADFVRQLFDAAGLSGHETERQSYVNLLDGGTTRAEVLRSVSESDAFRMREHNSAFVLMQYFGYLRRDPDEAGYEFWLNVLDSREPNNYRGMVCSFLTSAEYQKRFASVVAHTNAECGQ